MSLTSVSVSTDFFTTFLFVEVKPKRCFGSTTEQKIDPLTGLPVWTVSVLALYRNGAESLSISVPSETPNAGLSSVQSGASVVVSGLKVGAYVKGKYAQFYWRADKIEKHHFGLPTLKDGGA